MTGGFVEHSDLAPPTFAGHLLVRLPRFDPKVGLRFGTLAWLKTIIHERSRENANF